MPEPLLVDLIGCGSFGGELAAIVGGLPELALRGVYDTQAERAQALAARVGARAYPSLDEMLERSGAQALTSSAAFGIASESLPPTRMGSMRRARPLASSVST